MILVPIRNVKVANLSDGIDGELITWGADGKATTVAVGATTHVLTSNGAGAAPSMQAITAEGARVYNSANISVSNTTNTTLTFDSEAFDTGLHSTSTNTERLTIVRAGIYIVFATVRWAGHATGIRASYLLLNGSNSILASGSHQLGTAPDANAYVQQVISIAKLAVDDYMTVVVYQSSGGSLNVEVSGSGAESPVLSAVWLGA
jgi:hypothetical protein